jgi:hypothetical protein
MSEPSGIPQLLLPCRDCGGRPYAYDMREIEQEPACTVECGDCERSAFGDSPDSAAQAWNLTPNRCSTSN